LQKPTKNRWQKRLNMGFAASKSIKKQLAWAEKEKIGMLLHCKIWLKKEGGLGPKTKQGTRRQQQLKKIGRFSEKIQKKPVNSKKPVFSPTKPARKTRLRPPTQGFLKRHVYKVYKINNFTSEMGEMDDKID